MLHNWTIIQLIYTKNKSIILLKTEIIDSNDKKQLSNNIQALQLHNHTITLQLIKIKLKTHKTSIPKLDAILIVKNCLTLTTVKLMK